MFETTFSQVSESEISSSIPEDAIITLMHDFPLIAKLNPDCKDVHLVGQISENTWEYKVEDCLAFIPKKLWNGGVWYTAIYTTVPDGCDITVKAPGGFTSINRWRAIRPNDGKRIIRITSDAKCSKTFSVFVRKFLENSHGQLQRAFREKAGQISKPTLMRRRSSWPNEYTNTTPVAA